MTVRQITPAAAPPPTTNPVVAPPSVAQVRRAELELSHAGFNAGKHDGKISPEFTAAVKQFQAANGDSPTGQLDSKTLKRLDALAKAQKQHEKKHDQFITVGMSSKGIKAVEQQLAHLGYHVGKADGIYGRDTAAAVKAFRKDQSELVDTSGSLSKFSRGILGTESKGLSHVVEHGRTAPSKSQVARDRGTAAAAAKRGADGLVGFTEGARGPSVADVQKHLKAAGFDPQHLGGVFDERTTGALKAFQRHAGLPADGRVNPKTWRALQKTIIYSKSAASPAQKLNERSSAVKASEKLLKTLGFNPGKIDGLFTKQTAKAVRAFERQQHLKVDGTISTGELALMKKLTKGISLSQLHHIMPALSMRKARAYLPLLNRAMAEGHINTRQRKAMFLAQLAHESVQLKYFEEIASGSAYEGRADLGNTHPGDGRRYKGRGPIQLTGRFNYRHAGKALHLDLEGHPKLAAKPSVGFRTATWFWTTHGLNKLADQGNFREVTHRINGGYNGEASRLAYYHRALKYL